MLLLCDLSNNNPDPISFAALKRGGVYGVWFKVTEGQRYIDPFWHERSRRARAAGLHVGGYHFARPIHGLAEQEAEYFVKQLGHVERRDLRPVLDLEANDAELSPAGLHEWARTFLHAVNHLTEVRGLTYSNPAYIGSQHWTRTFGTGAGLWLADWGSNDGHDHPTSAPAPWRRYVAHQYTSRGVKAGVPGHVDLSHARARRRILAHPLRGLV